MSFMVPLNLRQTCAMSELLAVLTALPNNGIGDCAVYGNGCDRWRCIGKHKSFRIEYIMHCEPWKISKPAAVGGGGDRMLPTVVGL